MKKLPIGMPEFKDLIENNFIYVDKTEYIYKLITSQQYYFLSYPRRFGKSLLLSTLREVFLGNKKLFKNLFIDKKTKYNWPKHPIIQIDFSNISHTTTEEFRSSLLWELSAHRKRV